jgi:hypothetical protein
VAKNKKLERRIHPNLKKQFTPKGSQSVGLWPEIRNTKPEIRNELNGCYLKKQSQFTRYAYCVMLNEKDISSLLTSKYEDFSDLAAVKNKAKQSQFKPS